MRFGYRKELLAAILHPAPPQLKAMLRRAAEAVHAMSTIRTRLLQKGGTISTTNPEAGGERGVDASDEALLREAELWEGEREWAFLGVAYDAGTGQPRMVACNERAAEMQGEQRGALLASFAARTMEVPFVEVDWLANFIHDLEFVEETRNERYLRMAVHGAGGREGALVRSVKSRAFDAVGRVARVSSLPWRLSRWRGADRPYPELLGVVIRFAS
jgi:hypothetical protein